MGEAGIGVAELIKLEGGVGDTEALHSREEGGRGGHRASGREMRPTMGSSSMGGGGVISYQTRGRGV